MTGVILLALLVGPVVFLQQRKVQTPVSALASEVSRSRGPVGAPIRIIEYSNFHCPSCLEVQPMLEALLKKHPGKIRHEFRHFPEGASSISVMAHLAAESAAQQGRFWAYHDRLFQDRAGWISSNDSAVFVKYAQELGLDAARFLKELTDPKIRERLEADSAAGRSLGVGSTPTFFIGNRIFVGPQQFKNEAEPWIESLLNKK